jgi:hypothetical protein
MGYTHYWRCENWNDEDREGWKRSLSTIEKILDEHNDIIQYEDDTPEDPICDNEQIRFNGIDEDAHETFVVHNEATNFGFCKTARKPYDLVVCKVLLVLKAYCPHFNLNSDGFAAHANNPVLDGSWQDAIEDVKRFGIYFHSEVTNHRGQYVDLGIFPGKGESNTESANFVRVKISLDYVVPNDEEIIAEAKESLYEDLMNAYKYDELADWVEVEDAPDANTDDIPDFLAPVAWSYKDGKCPECGASIPLNFREGYDCQECDNIL